MRRKRIDGVTVGIVGGIGNQLFQYYAGRYLAEKNNSKLILDFGNHGVAGTKHLGTLRDLEFGIPIDELNTDSTLIREYFWRIHQKISRDIPHIGRFSTKYLRKFQSKVIGYDPELTFLHSPINIRGYFQTWRYIDSLDASFSETPSLRISSEWFRTTSDLIELNQPFAIHIRRGDYEKSRGTFGVLSRDYYSKALKALEIHGSVGKVFVFSDDIEKSKAILSLLDYDFTYIVPPIDSNPVESLFLMSKCSGLVIANSSFSWWAGKFGDPSRQIIAPSKWFRGLQDPSDLIPDHWKRIESCWE